MTKLLIVNGSVRSGRTADNVLKLVLEEIKKHQDIETTVADFITLPLPFFDYPLSPNNEKFAPTEPNVLAWTEMVKSADVVLLVTPEYNAGTSGVLKNAIDWIGAPWNDKPVAIIGYGWSNAASARKHLVDIMTRLRAKLLEPQAGLKFTDDIGPDGTVIDAQALHQALAGVIEAIAGEAA